MELIYLLTGMLLGGTLVFFYLKSRPGGTDSQKQARDLELANNTLQARLGDLQARLDKKEDELRAEAEKNLKSTERLARAEEAFKAQREQIAQQEKNLEELHNRFRLEFENVANKLLDEKSQKFTEHNRTQLDIILNPLKEKIKDFEDKVDKSYKAEAAERNVLKGEINKLVELNQVIMTEAGNLTKALKGDSKVQGNWGELVLERIMENSGLEKDREYKMQVSVTNEDGRRLQPDAVVMLPDEKHIIIDSKVSLVAYEALTRAEAQADRDRLTKEHLASLRTHIQALGSKEYHQLPGFNSPEFTLLFIPIESSFGLAIQADQELFNYAWDRKIVIVSPSTLLATLRTIASIWKQERQNKNALKIAEESGKLYDKFVAFVGDLRQIGERIGQSQKAYDEALGKLSEGRGNLVSRAENIRKLGARTSKELHNDILQDEAGEDDGEKSKL